MEFEIGKMVKIKGVDLLVLDIIKGNPFVIALNTGINTKFGNSNNYLESTLKKECEEWVKNLQISTIPRAVDLNATFTLSNNRKADIVLDSAPLTFDEYRKYYKIIKPYIIKYFWLCNPWESNNSTGVCLVGSNGFANWDNYISSGGLVPAFIIDRKSLTKETDLSKYSIPDLFSELKKRNVIIFECSK